MGAIFRSHFISCQDSNALLRALRTELRQHIGRGREVAQVNRARGIGVAVLLVGRLAGVAQQVEGRIELQRVGVLRGVLQVAGVGDAAALLGAGVQLIGLDRKSVV